MKNKIILALTIAIVTGVAFAQPKPEDQIMYRQSGMMFMRWNMGIIKDQVVKNPQNYKKDQVAAAANAIAAIANSRIVELFSPETKTGKGWKETRVKPEYFSQPEEVKKLTMDFKNEADTLVKVSNSEDVERIKEQFDVLFKACKACHKKFRTKE